MKRLRQNLAAKLGPQEVSDEFEFLYRWVDRMHFDMLSRTPKIIKDNPDCVYSGLAYRVYTIGRNLFVTYIKDNYHADNLNTGEVVVVNNKEYIIIRPDQLNKIAEEAINDKKKRYRSFSKDMDGVTLYANGGFEGPNDQYWLVQCYVDGLDIEKLYNKVSLQEIRRDPNFDKGFFYDIENKLGEHEVLALSNDSQEVIGFFNGTLQENYGASIDVESNEVVFYPDINTFINSTDKNVAN